MEMQLTKLQAYTAMVNFLDIYYEQTKSDDIGSLLGDMQFSSDGRTWDPAAWEDWTDSVNAIVKSGESLTKLQAFNAMRKFLEIYYEQTSSSDIGSIIRDSKILPNGTTLDPMTWSNWIKCVDAVLV